MALATTASSSGSRCWSAAAGRAAPIATAQLSSRNPRGHRHNARCGCGSRRQASAYEGERFTGGEFRAGGVTAVAVLEPSALEATLRHHQAVRNAEQLRVRELDAGARIAVVVEDLDAGGAELLVEAVADFADTGGFLQIERYQHQLEGGDRRRPDDAALVVVLLDGCRNDTRHTDAVTAHEERHFAA